MPPVPGRCSGRAAWALVVPALLLAVLAVGVSAAGGSERPLSDPRWVRCAVALYRMVEVTGTRSEARAEGAGKETFRGSVPPPSRAVPRVLEEDFVRVAREHPLGGISRADRRRLDDNVWHHVSRGSSLRSALHLHEQWGVEGRSLDRTPAQNVDHVESCSTCRSAYEEIVDGTRLGCGSEVIGFRRPPVNDDPDKRVTLPP